MHFSFVFSTIMSADSDHQTTQSAADGFINWLQSRRMKCFIEAGKKLCLRHSVAYCFIILDALAAAYVSRSASPRLVVDYDNEIQDEKSQYKTL